MVAVKITFIFLLQVQKCTTNPSIEMENILRTNYSDD